MGPLEILGTLQGTYTVCQKYRRIPGFMAHTGGQWFEHEILGAVWKPIGDYPPASYPPEMGFQNKGLRSWGDSGLSFGLKVGKL